MRHIARWSCAALAGMAVAVSAQTAQAQRAGRFVVAPRLGYVAWDKAAGLQDNVLHSGECDYPNFGQTCAGTGNNLQAGISALYAFTDRLALGITADVGRPVSNGAYFPAANMEIAGRQELTLVSQRLTTLQYGLEGQFTVLPESRVMPFLVGSVGGVVVYKDAPKVDVAGSTGFNTFSNFMFTFGGGFDYTLTGQTALRLEFRDLVYTSWDRSELNAISPAYQTQLFPDLLPAPPAAKKTLHNLRLALGFVFVPGAGR